MAAFAGGHREVHGAGPGRGVLPIAPPTRRARAARNARSRPGSSPPSAASAVPAATRPPVGRTAPDGVGLFEAEAVRRRGPWRSPGAVEFATLGRVGRSNNRRRLEPTGSMPPAGAEARHHVQLEPPAMAA
jgi:hypothetical protein